MDRLISEIAQALELPAGSISESSSSDNVDMWDSLGHLSILARLDTLIDGVTDRIPELATALSVQDIRKLLDSHGVKFQ